MGSGGTCLSVGVEICCARTGFGLSWINKKNEMTVKAHARKYLVPFPIASFSFDFCCANLGPLLTNMITGIARQAIADSVQVGHGSSSSYARFCVADHSPSLYKCSTAKTLHVNLR